MDILPIVQATALEIESEGNLSGAYSQIWIWVVLIRVTRLSGGSEVSKRVDVAAYSRLTDALIEPAVTTRLNLMDKRWEELRQSQHLG